MDVASRPPVDEGPGLPPMASAGKAGDDTGSPCSVRLPQGPLPPLVFACPHAGRQFPPDMGASAPPARLRRLEDAHMDLLVAQAPALGVPLVVGHVARS